MGTATENTVRNYSPTEEKIIEAARRLFTRKGYAAVKTREIAAEAGINLALLNYYFRSKEKLFEIIWQENLQQFVQGLNAMLNKENRTFGEAGEKLVSNYIDWLSTNPDPLLFVLNELRKDPDKLDEQMGKMSQGRSEIRNRLYNMLKEENMTHEDIFHLISNTIGLIIAPFIIQNLLQSLNKISREEFTRLMEERKRLIPQWLKAMKNIK